MQPSIKWMVYFNQVEKARVVRYQEIYQYNLSNQQIKRKNMIKAINAKRAFSKGHFIFFKCFLTF